MVFSLNFWLKITILEFKCCCSDDDIKNYINLTTKYNVTQILIDPKI